MRPARPTSVLLGLVAALSLSPAVAPPRVPAGEGGAYEVLPGLVVIPGPVNGVRIERGGKALAVYGDPRDDPPPADTVLFTHGRRDVVWAGRPLVERGARAVAPAAERRTFEETRDVWADLERKRFHDYSQESTKLPATPLRLARAVEPGESFDWEGLPVKALGTPGFTRGAVTYLVDWAGKRVAFTGDLIHGDGKILDLYSLQDAIPEARIGGYHGHAARLGQILSSLRALAAEDPALIVPARGPTIPDPAAAIERLASRIRAVYANYLSTDALRWYFGDDHILAKARRVLGPDARPEWLPMAETIRKELPAWIVPISNSRLLVAGDRSGFLIDCGSTAILEEVKKLQAAGKVGTVEHIFVTHYHDDHTDQVAKAAETFGATVHASPECRDILERPAEHRLPCLTMNPIVVSGRPPFPDRASAAGAANGSWRWKEFEVQVFHFPGQTLYHDALLVKRDGGETVFFIGDSFTPSGIDDYCLQNRNLLHEGMGFPFCLDLIGRVAPDALLVNQHVEPAFRFSPPQIDAMRAALRKRVELLRDLLPWDDPNFGLDEGWARLHPYAQTARPGETVRVRARIFNHSPVERVVSVRLRPPPGWRVDPPSPSRIRIPARVEGEVELRVTTAPDAAGLHVLTADVSFGDRELREWIEALVRVSG